MRKKLLNCGKVAVRAQQQSENVQLVHKFLGSESIIVDFHWNHSVSYFKSNSEDLIELQTLIFNSRSLKKS